MEWQPIETAPKDGTKLLVFTVFGQIEVTQYIRADREEEIGMDGWDTYEPAFWMPLPDPPKHGTTIRCDCATCRNARREK